MKLSQIIKSISAQEWKWLIILTLVMILLTNAVNVLIYLNTPAGYFYRGINSVYDADSSAYHSYITQIKDGQYLLKDNFTSELQTAGTLNIFWLVLGLLAKIFNLSPILCLHLANICLIPIYLFVNYLLISYFFSGIKKRRMALFFICFASGVGFLYISIAKLFNLPTAYLPYDLWSSFTSSFLLLSRYPHHVFSQILMVALFLLVLLAYRNRQYSYAIAAGILGLIWFNFHPYYFISTFVILLLYTVFLILKQRRGIYLLYFCLIIAICLPSVAYHYHLIKTVSYIGLRAGQNITTSLPISQFLIAYGFLFVCSLISIFLLIKNKRLKNKDVFFIIWAAGSLALAYSPLKFQNKYIMGIFIPMAYLTVLVLFYLKKRFHWLLKSIPPILITICLIICFGLTTCYNFASQFIKFPEQSPLYYLPNDYLGAFAWLKENNQQNKVILANKENGHIIPAFINQRVYAGHGHETLGYLEKTTYIENLFNNRLSDEELAQFLADNNIGYIFYTQTDRQNHSFRPEDKNYLEKAFYNGEVDIYLVNLANNKAALTVNYKSED